jgi:phosphinothricin acetyltransferase
MIVLNWRNEESVRLSSRNQALISIDQHSLWFATRVRNIHNEPILIFTSDNVDIGFTRLDLLDTINGIVEVSIVVTADFRNKGFGSLMLDATMEVARTLSGIREINATVREDNQASLKLFTAYGFTFFANNSGFVELRFSLLE